jgi:hypothetical protein
MSKQLRCRDLRAGDILLKFNAGSAVNRLIRLGQRLVGQQNPDVVHAGIMFDSTYIIESSGPGLVANDLRVQDKPFGYLVYRCRNAGIAQGAGTCAKMMFDIQGRTRGLKYGAVGAAKSLFGGPGQVKSRETMDDLLDRILEGKTHRFFCSQFVVYVYQFVAEQNGIPAKSMFNFNDAKVPPSTLASVLASHPLMEEEGYVLPNER